MKSMIQQYVTSLVPLYPFDSQSEPQLMQVFSVALSRFICI